MENGVAGAVPIPSNDAGKERVIAALVTNVEAMIKADRKITALKELQVRRYVVKLFVPPVQIVYGFSVSTHVPYNLCLSSYSVTQGHIWQTGFKNNELEGVVFDDVPEALERWAASGIKVPSVSHHFCTCAFRFFNEL